MEETPVAREEKGPVSVLTMQYRPYNLLGPTLLGAISHDRRSPRCRQPGNHRLIRRKNRAP